MHLSLPIWLRIPFAATLIGASTVLHVLPLFAVTLVKAVLPFAAVRRVCNPFQQLDDRARHPDPVRGRGRR
jgi:hypothetical protein